MLRAIQLAQATVILLVREHVQKLALAHAKELVLEIAILHVKVLLQMYLILPVALILHAPRAIHHALQFVASRVLELRCLRQMDALDAIQTAILSARLHVRITVKASVHLILVHLTVALHALDVLQ